MRGIRRSPTVTSRPRRNLVTPEILSLLLAAWSQGNLVSSYDATMLWAACCTGFFGFLRAGEFTCPSIRAFTQNMIGPQDVSVDSHDNPSTVMIHLRRSKADPFGTGITIFLGKTGQRICPVAALLSYMVLRGSTPGPLFKFQDGSSLSKPKLMARLRQALEHQRFDCAGITGHSFRIGAASTAARIGLEDSLIQTMGRWRSSAYLRYIQIPGRTLAATSARLISTTSPLSLSAQVQATSRPQ